MNFEEFFEKAEADYKVSSTGQPKESANIINDVMVGNFDAWWKLLPVGKLLYDEPYACNVLSSYCMANGLNPPTEISFSGNYAPDSNAQNIVNVLSAEIGLPYKIIYIKNSDESLKKDGFYLEYNFIFAEGFLKLYVYSDSVALTACGSEDLLSRLTKAAQKNLVDEPSVGTIYMMVAGARGLEFHSVGLAGCKLERENYTPDVLTSFDRMKSELVSINPKGRLNIIDGSPGGGKSFLIRGLLEEVKGACFVVVPAHYITALSEPSAIAALTKFKKDNNNRPIVLIAEDADQCLIKREEGQISAVSAVLNIGDGLMGAVWDIRIIATTNIPWIDLDPAIKRPGRLNTTINIKELDADMANAVFKRLTGSDTSPFNKPKLLAEIYQYANDSEWKRAETKKENKMGFGA